MRITKSKIIFSGLLLIIISKIAFEIYAATYYGIKVERLNDKQLKFTALKKISDNLSEVYDYESEKHGQPAVDDKDAINFSRGENEKVLIMNGVESLSLNHIYRIVSTDVKNRGNLSSSFCIRKNDVISSSDRDEQYDEFAKKCHEHN